MHYCAIVIVLLIIIISVNTTIRRYEYFLSGLWTGNSVFLNQSEILDFQLFISPCKNRYRQGYLIITDLDGKFVVNQAIEINISRNWSSAFCSVLKVNKDIYTCDFNISYDDETNLNTPIPEAVKMTLSILDGTLTLYDNEKVYAFMEKDLTTSAAAIDAYNADN